MPGDTVSSQTPLLAKASDKNGIVVIRFYVDDLLIAEDYVEPYEQVWYSGYWDDGNYYDLTVEAEDGNGNVARLEPINVFVMEDSQFHPVLISPSDEKVLEVGMYYDWVWEQVPGALGYIVKLRFPGAGEGFYQGCDIIEHETCYQYVEENNIERMAGGPTTTPMYWSVRAYRDMNHKTPWSEEWSVSSE